MSCLLQEVAVKEQLTSRGRSGRRSLSSPSVHRVKKNKYSAIIMNSMLQYDMISLNILPVCLSICSCLEVDRTCPQPACWTIR